MGVDDGVVVVGADFMTGHPGVFAGGDLVPAERTVTVGIGHSWEAAGHVDSWLRDTRLEPEIPVEPATFESLNTWYYANAPHTVAPELDLARQA